MFRMLKIIKKENNLRLPSSLHDAISPDTTSKGSLKLSSLRLNELYELSESNNFETVHVLITTC